MSSASVSAFSPGTTFSRGITRRSTISQRPVPPSPSRLHSEPPKEDDAEESGGLDLDLGEMLDLFEAADKEEDFDNTIKKVKGE